MFSKIYEAIIGVLVIAVVFLSISLYITEGKLDKAKANLVAAELQASLAIENHNTCKAVVEDNNKAISKYAKELKALKEKGPVYVTKFKTIYKDLNESDKAILDAELPKPIVRLLEDSSKN